MSDSPELRPAISVSHTGRGSGLTPFISEGGLHGVIIHGEELQFKVGADGGD